jgi:hypothetical protein
MVGRPCLLSSVNALYLFFRAAALAMFQRARKLSEITPTSSDFISLSELQLEAYTVAMNALSILDRNDAWITLPVPAKSSSDVSVHELADSILLLNHSNLVNQTSEIVKIHT